MEINISSPWFTSQKIPRHHKVPFPTTKQQFWPKTATIPVSESSDMAQASIRIFLCFEILCAIQTILLSSCLSFLKCSYHLFSLQRALKIKWCWANCVFYKFSSFTSFDYFRNNICVKATLEGRCIRLKMIEHVHKKIPLIHSLMPFLNITIIFIKKIIKCQKKRVLWQNEWKH